MPVIVVGNVFIGGTGKTPFVIWLAEELRAAGCKPGIISRGYGANGDTARAVTASSHAAEVGDEPLLMAQRTGCPLYVGRHRAEVGRALLAAHLEVDILIADDGLQHYALQRDVEIVMCDNRGNGNGWLLPAGPLRESVRRRRDFTVVNASRMPQDVPSPAFLLRLAGDTAWSLAAPAQSRPLSAFAGQKLAAIAGIGNPARFFQLLSDAGLQFDASPLPDHHDFTATDFAHLRADAILITEKDAVKCRQLEPLKSDPRVWVVPVTAQVDFALTQQILEKCRGFPSA